MLVLFLVLFGISFLILAHEAGHFFVARRCGMKIEEFGFGLPPRIFGIKRGETVYSINLFPFGGFVKIAGENEIPEENLKEEKISEENKKKFFCYQPPSKKALVTVAGVLVNFLIGWILISSVIAIGKPFSIVVLDVVDGSPAQISGIQKGDLILGFQSEYEFRSFIAQNPGKEISLKVKRNGEIKNIKVNLEDKNGRGFFGAYFVGGEIKKEPIYKAFWSGFLVSLEIIKLNFYGVYNLLSNLISGRGIIEGIVGPVGIVNFSKKVGEISLLYLLNIFGIISISLAFVNLIPFPALDGGRLLFILIEKIKKSPVSFQIESIINSIGFALLLILVIIITIRDFKTLF